MSERLVPCRLVQLVLLLVAAVGGVPVAQRRSVKGRWSHPLHSEPRARNTCAHSYGLGFWGVVADVLEQFLDEVDVGHDHAAAAVSLEAKLVHRIAVYLAHVVSLVFANFPHRQMHSLTHPGCSGQSAPDSAPTGHQSPMLLSVVVACGWEEEPAHLATGEAAHRDDHFDWLMGVDVLEKGWKVQPSRVVVRCCV